MDAQNPQREAGPDLDRAIEDAALHPAGHSTQTEWPVCLVPHVDQRETTEQGEMPLLVGSVDPSAMGQAKPGFFQAPLQIGEVLPRADLAQPEDIGRDGAQGGNDRCDGLRRFRRGERCNIARRGEEVIADVPRCEHDVLRGSLAAMGSGGEQGQQHGRDDRARREHGKSGRLVRLFVRSFLGFEGGGGFFDFAVEFLAGLAEFVDALPEALGQLRETLGPEEDQNDQQDKQDLSCIELLPLKGFLVNVSSFINRPACPMPSLTTDGNANTNPTVTGSIRNTFISKDTITVS